MAGRNRTVQCGQGVCRGWRRANTMDIRGGGGAMRSKFAVAALALALVAAASGVIANPVGVPPTAKPIDVIEGKTISIELGTPTAHGWYVLIWGGYKVGDQEFLANGAAREGEFNPGAGCVYIAWEGGGQCFFPSENQATGRMSFSSPFMAGRRSRWA